MRMVKKYRENGMEELINKKKPGNSLSKYSNKKTLTKEEQLEYENIIGYDWNTTRPFEKIVSDTTSFYFKKQKYDWTFYIDVFNNRVVRKLNSSFIKVIKAT